MLLVVSSKFTIFPSNTNQKLLQNFEQTDVYKSAANAEVVYSNVYSNKKQL
jgi:hypothetical protein